MGMEDLPPGATLLTAEWARILELAPGSAGGGGTRAGHGRRGGYANVAAPGASPRGATVSGPGSPGGSRWVQDIGGGLDGWSPTYRAEHKIGRVKRIYSVRVAQGTSASHSQSVSSAFSLQGSVDDGVAVADVRPPPVRPVANFFPALKKAGHVAGLDDLPSHLSSRKERSRQEQPHTSSLYSVLVDEDEYRPVWRSGSQRPRLLERSLGPSAKLAADAERGLPPLPSKAAMPARQASGEPSMPLIPGVSPAAARTPRRAAKPPGEPSTPLSPTSPTAARTPRRVAGELHEIMMSVHSEQPNRTGSMESEEPSPRRGAKWAADKDIVSPMATGDSGQASDAKRGGFGAFFDGSGGFESLGMRTLKGLKLHTPRRDRIAMLDANRKQKAKDEGKETFRDRVSRREDVDRARESFQRYFGLDEADFDLDDAMEA